jgi:hypothetical protein
LLWYPPPRPSLQLSRHRRTHPHIGIHAHLLLFKNRFVYRDHLRSGAAKLVSSDAAWRTMLTRKGADDKGGDFSYVDVNEAPEEWTDDIGQYKRLPKAKLTALYAPRGNYKDHMYKESFPLGDGNRSSAECGVSVADLAQQVRVPALNDTNTQLAFFWCRFYLHSSVVVVLA